MLLWAGGAEAVDPMDIFSSAVSRTSRSSWVVRLLASTATGVGGALRSVRLTARWIRRAPGDVDEVSCGEDKHRVDAHKLHGGLCAL